MCNYCSHGTLLRNSALQVLAGVFATATKICTHGGSTRALALTASKLTVASFLLVGSTLVKKQTLPPTVRHGHHAQRHSFSGLVDSAGELLHTP